MHDMQPIVTDVRGVCPSVSLSVCHRDQLSLIVQQWLNRSRCCSGEHSGLLGAHGTLCYTGVLIPHRQGEGDLLLNFGTALLSPERLKLHVNLKFCVHGTAYTRLQILSKKYAK